MPQLTKEEHNEYRRLMGDYIKLVSDRRTADIIDSLEVHIAEFCENLEDIKTTINFNTVMGHRAHPEVEEKGKTIHDLYTNRTIGKSS